MDILTSKATEVKDAGQIIREAEIENEVEEEILEKDAPIDIIGFTS